MSNEGRICPQCSYQRQPKDLAPDYECPRCGIIYAKYRPPETKPSPPAPENASGGGPPSPVPPEGPALGEGGEGVPTSEEDQPLPPASPLIRTFAGIHTTGLVLLYFVPAKLFLYGLIRTWYPPESIRAGIPNRDYFEMAYYGFLLLLVIYAFLVTPWLDGRTWGQSKFSLALRPKDDQEGSLAFREHLLRFAGHLIALATWPVTAVGFLYNLYAKGKDPGIADRVSGTRQYETVQPPPFRAGLAKAFFPACLAMLLQVALVGPLCAWIMKDYFKPPATRSTLESARQAQQGSHRKTQESLARQMRIMYGEQAGQMAPGQAVPGQAVPGQTAPGQTAPGQTAPGQTAPGQTAPGQAAPGQAAPAEASPEPGVQAEAGPGTPTGTTERRATTLRQNSLDILAAMEKRHQREQGSFTEDLESLAARYGANPDLLALIAEGTLRARKTVQGVEIWMQNQGGEWVYREVRK